MRSSKAGKASKASIGSLSSMASKVRQEKKKKKNSVSANAKTPLGRAHEPKKPFKSAETVVESDSDGDSSSDNGDGSASASDSDIDAARAKFLAAKAAKQNKNKNVEPKVNGTKSAATPSKPTVRGSTPTSAQKRASESASESGSGSESESDTSDSGGAPSVSKPDASQKSGGSRTKRGSSSDSTSSSGSSSESEDAGTKNNTLRNGKPLTREESEESESDSSSDDEMPDAGAQPTMKSTVADAEASSGEESDSGSESDDEGDGGKLAVARTNGKNATKESTSQILQSQLLNNSDFMLRKASSDNPGKEVADFFSNANLEGKQVWYFTAPASLPITVLKDMEIDLAKATNGGALLSHNGDNYGLDLEPYATNTQIQLLIPSSGGEKYASLNHGIDSTIHLRRMAKFGPGGEVSATATDNYIPVPKPTREQPADLRVRYTPIGVPTPPVSSITPAKLTPTNAPGSHNKTKDAAQPSSSSESEPENDSNVEMTAPSASITPASQKNPAKSNTTNGDRKRKHAGSEAQSAKRLKAAQLSELPAVKQTAAQASNPGATANATPSKKSSTKSNDRKEKTPKSVVPTPTTAKQTPIPLPKYPGMKR